MTRIDSKQSRLQLQTIRFQALSATVAFTTHVAETRSRSNGQEARGVGRRRVIKLHMNTTHLPFTAENSSILAIANHTASGTTTKRHIIGVSLAISGNILISLALSVQKYAHNRLGSGGKYILDSRWWCGMLMMALGEFGNFMAYGFAPASLVAPLGSVAVMTNAFIAIIFLKEAVTPHSIMGVTFVIIGSIFLISFSATGYPSLSVEELHSFLKAWTFLVYIAFEAVVLMILLYLNIFRQMEHQIILLLIVALVASATVISAKAVSTLLSESLYHGVQSILHPSFWIMLFLLPVTTVVQVRYLNRAMQLYNVSDVVPVNFIFFTVSAILAGTIFYQEFYGVPFLKVFMFLFGCLLSFIGVYIISHCKTTTTLSCFKRSEGLDSVTDLAKESDGDISIPKKRHLKPDQAGHSGRRAIRIPRLSRILKQAEIIEEVQPRTLSTSN